MKALLLVLCIVSAVDVFVIVDGLFLPSMAGEEMNFQRGLRSLFRLENDFLHILLLIVICWLSTMPIRKLSGPWRGWCHFALVVQMIVLAHITTWAVSSFFRNRFTLDDVKYAWISTYHELFFL